MGNFDLSATPMPPSFIEEVAVVGDSVDRMKASLRSFGRYVPTDLVRDLLAQGQEARLDGRERPLTLFFSDVKGFTSVSEGMAPQHLIDALGDYLDVVVKAVQAHRGTIDKFMGDGVLAFFNAPRDDAVLVTCQVFFHLPDCLTEQDVGFLHTIQDRMKVRTEQACHSAYQCHDGYLCCLLTDSVISV